MAGLVPQILAARTLTPSLLLLLCVKRRARAYTLSLFKFIRFTIQAQILSVYFIYRTLILVLYSVFLYRGRGWLFLADYSLTKAKGRNHKIATIIKEAILHKIVHEICLVSLIKDSVEELKLFTVSALPGRPDLIRSLTACSFHITQDVGCHFELARDVEKLVLFFLLVPIEVAELDCIPFQQRIDQAARDPPGQVRQIREVVLKFDNGAFDNKLPAFSLDAL